MYSSQLHDTLYTELRFGSQIFPLLFHTFLPLLGWEAQSGGRGVVREAPPPPPPQFPLWLRRIEGAKTTRAYVSVGRREAAALPFGWRNRPSAHSILSCDDVGSYKMPGGIEGGRERPICIHSALLLLSSALAAHVFILSPSLHFHSHALTHM